jgi:hypothetical protein
VTRNYDNDDDNDDDDDDDNNNNNNNNNNSFNLGLFYPGYSYSLNYWPVEHCEVMI